MVQLIGYVAAEPSLRLSSAHPCSARKYRHIGDAGDAARPVEDHRGASEDASIQLVEQLNLTKAHGESAGSQRAEDLAAGGNYICYAAKANSLLVRADGRIGKCTVALNDPRNDIGRLAEDGSVVIDNDKLRPWISGLGTLDVATLGCPLSRLTP